MIAPRATGRAEGTRRHSSERVGGTSGTGVWQHLLVVAVAGFNRVPAGSPRRKTLEKLRPVNVNLYAQVRQFLHYSI